MSAGVEAATAKARDGWVVRHWPAWWALALSVLLLGGALGRGYVLSYDMVWVRDLALGRDALGLGSALPRAVPSDAVVAMLDELLGGMLLQKIVLIGALVGAGAGCAALVADRSAPARAVAVTLGVWNPFVVERLLLGHWPLLIGYAVLPWLVVALRDSGGSFRLGRVLPLLVLGSLSASAGLATAVVALAMAARQGVRRWLVVAGAVAAANAPWVVAGLASGAKATSDPWGARLFATASEGMLPGPAAALSFGGVWNAEVVPPSRVGVAGLALTILLAIAAVVGLARVVRGTRVDGLGAIAACWGVGWGLATLSWLAPAWLGRLASEIPGGGLLRDGSRLLGLAVPLIVILIALAVDALVARLPDPSSVAVVGVTLALLPIALMPDALWGVGGRMQAVDYPASYAEARAVVRQAPPGDLVSLPFESYRAPTWNDGRRVLDPLGRALGRTAVVNDELVVSGRRLAGEDARVGEVARALEEPTPSERSAALRAAGVSVVVIEQIEGYPVPAIAGTAARAGDLEVITLGSATPYVVDRGRTVAMAFGWLCWLTLLLAGIVSAAGSRWRRGAGSGAGAGGPAAPK